MEMLRAVPACQAEPCWLGVQLADASGRRTAIQMPNFNIWRTFVKKTRHNAMFTLTIQKNKDGFSVHCTIDFHQLALAAIALFGFFG